MGSATFQKHAHMTAARSDDSVLEQERRKGREAYVVKVVISSVEKTHKVLCQHRSSNAVRTIREIRRIRSHSSQHKCPIQNRTRRGLHEQKLWVNGLLFLFLCCCDASTTHEQQRQHYGHERGDIHDYSRHLLFLFFSFLLVCVFTER